jgi:RNA polymerase sigma-70 factor (ECF subfamily)
MNLEKLIAGDRDAFETLYTNTCDDVYRIVSYLVVDRQDVYDIVNEVYLRMWKSLHTYQPDRDFRFWLHGLVVRTVQDWKRSIWRRLRLLDRKKSLEVEEFVRTEEQVLAQETRSELLESVQQLSYKLRVVIILRYFQQYSLEEIATLLQIPVGTVKSRHHLALGQLRTRITTLFEGKAESNHVY